MSKYQSHSIKRQVRRAGTTGDGAQAFTVKSMTKAGTSEHAAPVYQPTINHQTGRVSCTCLSFQYRHAAAAPTLQDGLHHCKHIAQAVQGYKRRGELTSPVVSTVTPTSVPRRPA